jgi:hypothetical protein
MVAMFPLQIVCDGVMVIVGLAFTVTVANVLLAQLFALVTVTE